MASDPTKGLRALEVELLNGLSCSDTSDIGLRRLRYYAELILSVRQRIKAVEIEFIKNRLSVKGDDLASEVE